MSRHHQPTRCFLDMDGVLVHWTLGVCELFGRDHAELYPVGSRAPWGAAAHLGIEASEFWGAQDNHDFWAGLSKTPEADAILATVTERFGDDNVYVLSSPGRIRHCMTGTFSWLEEHDPQLLGRFLFGSAKHAAASPAALLIDDHQDNTRRFVEAGGHSYLVPRSWNDHYEREPWLIRDLSSSLSQLLAGDGA